MSQAATNPQHAEVKPFPPPAGGVQADVPALIRLVDIHKAFGNQKVLSGVTLDLPTAKTTVVLGPSGTGKSVMLKLIVGLLKPDKGEIWFDGKRIDQMRERDMAAIRLQIGLLFQMGALFDSMTVEQNIGFPLDEHLKLNEAERTKRIKHALEMVDLAGVQKKLPSQLSGGQRKRVALARAVVLEPRMVLYDEPTTGLDPVRADGINELVIKLKNTLGVTSLVVTHDLASAKKISDRVIMLYGGKVIADGTFDELQSHEDERVRHFFKGEYAADFDASDADKTDTKSDIETRE